MPEIQLGQSVDLAQSRLTPESVRYDIPCLQENVSASDGSCGESYPMTTPEHVVPSKQFVSCITWYEVSHGYPETMCTYKECVVATDRHVELTFHKH